MENFKLIAFLILISSTFLVNSQEVETESQSASVSSDNGNGMSGMSQFDWSQFMPLVMQGMSMFANGLDTASGVGGQTLSEPNSFGSSMASPAAMSTDSIVPDATATRRKRSIESVETPTAVADLDKDLTDAGHEPFVRTRQYYGLSRGQQRQMARCQQLLAGYSGMASNGMNGQMQGMNGQMMSRPGMMGQMGNMASGMMGQGMNGLGSAATTAQGMAMGRV